MALIKDFETPHKITASYHKLLKTEFDMQGQRIELVFAIFASAEARDSGGSVLWHEYVTIPFAALKQDPRVALYGLAQAATSCYLSGASRDELGVPVAAPVEFNPDYTPA